MHIRDILLWGLLATGLLTTLLRVGQALTRMDPTFLLGTMVTSNRDHAKVIGFGIHFLNGWLTALLYAAFLHGLGIATWWLGALMGSAHALFILVVVLPLLPQIHPRMASDFRGPDPTRLLWLPLPDSGTREAPDRTCSELLDHAVTDVPRKRARLLTRFLRSGAQFPGQALLLFDGRMIRSGLLDNQVRLQLEVASVRRSCGVID